MKFFFRPQAKQDLDLLLQYIAKDNMDAAHRMRDAILYTCGLLIDNPYISNEISSVSIQGIRRFPVSGFNDYVIFYIVREDGIEIVRLGFGGRDWNALI